MNSLRLKLASAFHLCALKGWDNWTYTHISARLPDQTSFLINRLNILYKDVTPESLVEVDMAQAPEMYFDTVNPTGVHIHKSIYEKRPDINAIFHLHTPHGVAVSAMECGLLPLSQFALHFYDRISTHKYDSLVLDEKSQAEQLAHDLGNNFTMLLENHGTLTSGKTLEEAFFYTHHLEEACRVQCLTLACNTPYIKLSHETCKKASADLLSFEKNLGMRDWNAAQTLLESKK
ncbi:MAG: class II aldolase/adducin family protein [Candidatus Paracaedibacteraceae bacterium]|nr:class II aldolase/adducin family protein [Candidatus Paracaedibacteraceae bacterium]